ncbi:MAG: hypothetical protein D6820_02835, partial [Lentisphaerae bacterium]
MSPPSVASNDHSHSLLADIKANASSAHSRKKAIEAWLVQHPEQDYDSLAVGLIQANAPEVLIEFIFDHIKANDLRMMRHLPEIIFRLANVACQQPSRLDFSLFYRNLLPYLSRSENTDAQTALLCSYIDYLLAQHNSPESRVRVIEELWIKQRQKFRQPVQNILALQLLAFARESGENRHLWRVATRIHDSLPHDLAAATEAGKILNRLPAIPNPKLPVPLSGLDERYQQRQLLLAWEKASRSPRARCETALRFAKSYQKRGDITRALQWIHWIETNSTRRTQEDLNILMQALMLKAGIYRQKKLNTLRLQTIRTIIQTAWQLPNFPLTSFITELTSQPHPSPEIQQLLSTAAITLNAQPDMVVSIYRYLARYTTSPALRYLYYQKAIGDYPTASQSLRDKIRHEFKDWQKKHRQEYLVGRQKAATTEPFLAVISTSRPQKVYYKLALPAGGLPSDSAPVTICAWVRFDANEKRADDDPRIIFSWSNGRDRGFHLGLLNDRLTFMNPASENEPIMTVDQHVDWSYFHHLAITLNAPG